MNHMVVLAPQRLADEAPTASRTKGVAGCLFISYGNERPESVLVSTPICSRSHSEPFGSALTMPCTRHLEWIVCGAEEPVTLVFD